MFRYFFSIWVVGILGFPLFSQSATINFKILHESNQQPMPAKMVILQNGAPFHHQLESTITLACREHTIYTATGTGSFQLPAGQYEIWFGKGMEYSIDTQNHHFEAGKTYEIQAVLRQEINTDGFVGGDMHLHTYTFSGHGDATVEERLISCAAEGLEWAVSTDHNYVLDYAPYMDTLGLTGWMATSVGNEVSTGIGHFNTYPLDPTIEKAKSDITDGIELFNHFREIAAKDLVIQVNHPRWIDSDYFNTKGLDPYLGGTKHPEWSWDFDAIEVLNETTQLGWIPAPDNKFSVINDWIHFQNRNHRITALGNSDTHSAIEMLAGVPRNYIASSTDTPSEINESEIVQSIKNQQVSVSSGIFVNMTANNFGIGKTVYSNGKAIDFRLTVQAASWISCNKVEFLKNGQVIQTFDIPKTTDAIRLDTTIRLAPKQDCWFMCIAYGDEPTPPILQIKKKPIIPKGFTNPIWVDASGSDGKIESVYDFSQKRALKSHPDSLAEFIARHPESVPYIFQMLFEYRHPEVVSITHNFLKNASTEQRLMLYRELSKLGGPEAESLLNREKENYLTPLEEVTLEWYLHFPLSKSRLDNFKEKQNDLLDEQLSWLEREFLYVHVGSVKRNMQLWLDEAETQKEVHLSKDGVLKFDKNKDELKDGTAHLQKSIFAIKDTTLTAYLRTNSPAVTIKNNGETISRIFDNLNANIEEKIISIPVNKRWNKIQLFVEAREGTEISFLPFSNQLIFDEAQELNEVKHLAIDKPVKYITEYSPKYHGFGDALTDGLRGNENHGSQLWQAWNGENMEIVLDLEQTRNIEEIQIGLLRNHKSWIFYPTKIELHHSMDGENFEEAYSQELPSPNEFEQTEIQNWKIPFETKTKVRFIKIIAHKLPQIPEWHPAAGSDGSWIFVDEVMVY